MRRPRCGARTRCRRLVTFPGERCRLHGGASTGPRTPEGLARLSELAHAAYVARALAAGWVFPPEGMRAAVVDLEQRLKSRNATAARLGLTWAGVRRVVEGRPIRPEELERIARALERCNAALAVLTARAMHDGPCVEVAVRVADCGDTIYLDLGDAEGRAVEMKAGGWRVVTDSPVRFRMPRGMLPLPEPVPGGAADELRELLTVGEDDWRLIVGWLLAALRPARPMPVLALHGEAGTAKTTTMRMLRGLVDPARPMDRARPRDERDLLIAARNGWVLGLDNLSGMPEWLSDALCRLATGAGYATRELYTDGDEVLIDVQRPVVVTGIDELLGRGDLADRALRVELPPIPEERRMPEAELWARYEAMRPRVLGALCDAVCGALLRLPHVAATTRELPRMADYALWVTAAETELGWPDGSALAAYRAHRGELAERTVDGDPVASAVRRLLGRCDGGEWRGTAGELLEALGALAAGPDGHPGPMPPGWPRTPRALADRLRRAAPALRRVGVDVTGPVREGHGGPRRYSVRSAPGDARIRPSPPSPRPPRNPPGRRAR